MCEANAYIERDGKEELVMEAVDVIVAEAENKLLIINIFGDQKLLHGKIKKLSLVKHKIILESVD